MKALVAGCAGFLTLAVAGCGHKLAGQSAETVTVGYTEYHPLVWSVAGQRPRGFVVQVFEEAARRENLRLRWVASDAPALDAIRNRSAQIWPVFPTRTPDARGAHITSPWWRTDFGLIVRGEDVDANAAEWQGNVALHDFPPNVRAAAKMPHATPKLYPSADAAVEAFCKGETDAVLLGYFRAYNLLNRRPAVCRDVPFQMQLLSAAGTDLSVLASPETAGVAERFRLRLDEMAIDGTLLRIALRYPGAMPGMSVHLARLSQVTANTRRRQQVVLAMGIALAAFAALLLKLIFDRRRRMRAEEALRASEDRLRLALVAASMKSWDWAEERASITDPEELRRIEAEVHAALSKGSAIELEYSVRDEDGKQRWLLVKAHAVPLRDRLTGIAIDITQRKLVETERAEIEERFRRAVLESPVPMMIYAEDGEVLNLSRSWTHLAGYTIHDIPTLRRWNEVALKRASSQPELGEMPVLTRDGDIRAWLLSHASLGRLPDGRKLALLAAVDMTERHKTEDQLRKASLELEQYAYAASHDLQEPMRVIGLYSQLLLRKHSSELSPQAQTYFETITREAARLTGIVEGLISYSRLVCETDPIPEQTVPLSAVVSRVLAEMRPLTDATGAQITVESLPVVQGELHALTSVIGHLLSNAVKYVPPGVTPQIRIFAKREGENWTVSVQDNGVGIPVEYHNRIWGVFKRLHGRDIPGTGIGLAVVRKVIQQHGGKAWVESSGGGSGSIFRIRLRAAVEVRARNGDPVSVA